MKFTITIQQGRKLVAKDRSAFGMRTTSDPYIKITLLDKFYGQTKVQYKTTSPVWNESFPIVVVTNDGKEMEQTKQALMQSSILLTIWDCDQRTKDDPMGVVMIPCNDFLMNNTNGTEFSRWYPVQQGSPDKNYYCQRASGEVQVLVSMDDDFDVMKPQSTTKEIDIAFSTVLQQPEEEEKEVIVVSMAEKMDQCIIEPEIVMGEVPVNDSSEHLPAVLTCSKTMYYQGENIVLNYSYNQADGVTFGDSDFITVVPENTTKNEYPSSYVAWEGLGDDAGSSTGTKLIIVNWKVGKYKALLFMEGGQKVLAISNVFEVKATSVTLTTNQLSYDLGEYLELKFECTDNVPFRENDSLYVVSENATKNEYKNSYVVWENLGAEAGTTSGTIKFTVKWKVGKYKVILFLEGNQIVLAHSNVFEVKPTTVTLTTNQASYDQGQRLVVNFASTGNVSFRENDFITIVSESATKNEYNSSYVAWENLGEEGGSSSGSKSFMIKWKVGKYKAVMFLEGGQTVLAVSDVFEVKSTTAVITTNQSSYELGQRIVLNFSITGSVPFRENDFINIVSENATKNEYSSSYVAWENLGEDGGSLSGTKTFQIQWKVGKYKAVMFLEGGQTILAVSDVFEVMQTPSTLKSNRSSYYLGESLDLEFSTTSSVLFRENDYITVVSEFATKSEYDSAYVAWENIGEEGGSTSGTKTFRIKWKIGKYKAIMFVEGGQVIAVSNVFEIMTIPTVLKSTQSSYQVGQNLIVEFSNTVNVPFRPSDYITVVPENATKNEYDSSYVAWINLGDDSGSSSESKSIPIYWAIGKYKAVLFLDGGQNVLAISNVFEVK